MKDARFSDIFCITDVLVDTLWWKTLRYSTLQRKMGINAFSVNPGYQQ